MIWFMRCWFLSMLGSTACMHRCKPDTINLAFACIMSDSLVTNAKKPSLIVQSTPYFLISFSRVSLEGIPVVLAGPSTASKPHGNVTFYGLTFIDITILSSQQFFEKSINHILTCFEHSWLSRYPKSM